MSFTAPFELPTTPTISLTRAAEMLGIGRSSAYTAVREGNFPAKVIKIGGRYVVPTRPFLDVLGLLDESAIEGN